MENQKMKDIKYIIADNMKLYRKKQKLTQMKLAELADLSVDSIKPREGMEQRIVPTGMAARDNEVKQRRNFSEKHFPGVAPCGFRLVGHDGGAVRDVSRPSVCYPVRGWARADLIFSDETEG